MKNRQYSIINDKSIDALLKQVNAKTATSQMKLISVVPVEDNCFTAILEEPSSSLCVGPTGPSNILYTGPQGATGPTGSAGEPYRGWSAVACGMPMFSDPFFAFSCTSGAIAVKTKTPEQLEEEYSKKLYEEE